MSKVITRRTRVQSGGKPKKSTKPPKTTFQKGLESWPPKVKKKS